VTIDAPDPESAALIAQARLYPYDSPLVIAVNDEEGNTWTIDTGEYPRFVAEVTRPFSTSVIVLARDAQHAADLVSSDAWPLPDQATSDGDGKVTIRDADERILVPPRGRRGRSVPGRTS
jgi:hypothetical protein